MNQNIKSFEEFKEIYTNPEFKDKFKELYKLKKRYQKFIIFMFISVILIYISCIATIWGIIVMTIIICIIGFKLFGSKGVRDYPMRYNIEVPYLIAKLAGVELITKVVDEEEYFKNISGQDGRLEQLKSTFKATRQYEKDKAKKIREMDSRNYQQFVTSHIVKADKYYTSNIARFIHNNTNTTVDLYHAEAYNIKEKTYEDENGREKTEKTEHLVNKGLVLSIENLEEISLNNMTILIKNNDTIISHLTENTIDNFKKMKNEIKFNRIDLNKSFDCYILGKKKESDDLKLKALEIITPTVEDLLAYIREKYGKYNLAINNNKIDIELLDTYKFGKKNIAISPKIFSKKDLKISYLYRFYELIEIQKLILKYFNCYPEKYLITEEDINGIKEAIETNKIRDAEMNQTVKDVFNEIIGGK